MGLNLDCSSAFYIESLHLYPSIPLLRSFKHYLFTVRNMSICPVNRAIVSLWSVPPPGATRDDNK